MQILSCAPQNWLELLVPDSLCSVKYNSAVCLWCQLVSIDRETIIMVIPGNHSRYFNMDYVDLVLAINSSDYQPKLFVLTATCMFCVAVNKALTVTTSN